MMLLKNLFYLYTWVLEAAEICFKVYSLVSMRFPHRFEDKKYCIMLLDGLS